MTPGPRGQAGDGEISESGGAKTVQFARSEGVPRHHQGLTPTLEPQARRGECRDGQQTDTKDANRASWALGIG